MIFHINTKPAQAMERKGHACFPGDFSHLVPGQKFIAWRSGDDWEIETILEGLELEQRLKEFITDCKRRRRMWEVKYRRRDGKVDFLWYGSLVDETEVKRRTQDMRDHGLEVLDVRAIDRLPTNHEYLDLLKNVDLEVIYERDHGTCGAGTCRQAVCGCTGKSLLCPCRIRRRL